MSLTRRTASADAARERGEAMLLAATTALLDEGATFGDLPIDRIAKRAGYSRATFYAYFRDKRELVLRLAEHFDAAIQRAADGWLSGEVHDERATLGAIFEVFRSHHATLRALVESASYDDAVAGFWRGVHEHFRASVADRLVAAAPELDADAVAARSFALIWMTERALSEHLAAPVASDDGLLDALALLWRSALAPSQT